KTGPPFAWVPVCLIRRSAAPSAPSILGDPRSRSPLSHPSTMIRTDVRSHDLASLNTLRTRRTVRTPIRTWVRVGTTRNRLAERGRRWIDGGGNPGDGSRAGEARGPRG